MTTKLLPPTDLELMMYHDGELDEPRHAAVRAWLAEGTDHAAPAKLRGLALVGDFVRDGAAAVVAEGITTAIMDEIRAERAQPSKDELGARAGGNASISKTSGRRLSNELQAVAPANENGKLLFGLAGLAAAAAAALFLWGRSPADGPVATGNEARIDSSATTEASPEPIKVAEREPPATAAPQIQASSTAAEDDDDAPRSVEVAAVDFGSRSGAIYYVSGENKPTSTTVVWVRDE